MEADPKVNILLVDDYPENLLALEAILKNLGHNLVKANSGKEALKHLFYQDFAVILLDVQMPDMDGFETAILIRQRERSRHTPIIFVTAFSSSNQMVSKGYSLGAVDYLIKPIESEILKSKVSSFVELFQKTAEVKKQATELASVNAQLKTSEERFRCLSACSPVGIFTIDKEGYCTYMNPRSQGICGLTLEDSLAEGWLQSVHPEDRVRVWTEWFDCIKKDWEYSNEFRLLIKQKKLQQNWQGEPALLEKQMNSDQEISGDRITDATENIVRWVHVRSSPMFSDGGEPIGHVGTIEDITARKEAEEERSKLIREQAWRQEAEAANRMKDEFLAIVSHELRTPLHSILGWAQILRTKKLDENVTARALETIERNSLLQVRLIDDILDVSRMIRGQFNLIFAPLNLASVIQVAVDSVFPAANTKGIELVSILDSSGAVVSGDAARLQQIVWNLLSNAIKFTAQGGRVEVQLSMVTENKKQEIGNAETNSELSNTKYARIQVRDSGIGISKDFLPHVFELFRQADSSTTRRHSGLGLGLALVRYLVEQHGGNIWVESEGEGKGATFTVDLPVVNNSPLSEIVDDAGITKSQMSEHQNPIPGRYS